jgi:serine protease AprX
LGVARCEVEEGTDVRTRGGTGQKRATAASRRARTIAPILVLAVAVGAPSTLAAARDPAPRAQVIVMAAPGATASVESAVEQVGGVVERRLSIISGFSAAVPADAIPNLRGLPGVVSVSADAEMQPQTATYDPATDVNSMNAVTRYTGAVDWWSAGYTGAGIDVAVIDTGVSPVEGLATPGKVLNGPDLSIESQAPNLRYLDTFGHGTFMAGLIAGHDSALTAPYADAPPSAYRGMAPDARIVSLKVGTADGGTDVSQVIAAIDWVVQHAQDPGLNIRILNLSYGTNSTQSYTIDPLAFAAEQAWKHGIVVVAAGGNSGFQRHMNNAPALSNPAIDPFLLAVGASDSQGTDTLADDLVPAFSPWAKRGATRGVDMVAPGTHLQGLRVPNSFIDANHPEGLLGDQYFRGSGTSQAAAIISGAVALVLQKFPSATPDQVKQLLTTTGYPISGKSQAIGGGELQLSTALAAPLPTFTQWWAPSTGVGSLELARGQDHISMDGVVLDGERDIMGSTFNAAEMALLEAQAKTWSGGDWNAKTWSGDSWSGNSWSASTWSGDSWSAKTWSSCVFSTNWWEAKTWSAKTWSGDSWSGATWSGGVWATESWS